jgi:hypothetical protein
MVGTIDGLQTDVVSEHVDLGLLIFQLIWQIKSGPHSAAFHRYMQQTERKVAQYSENSQIIFLLSP